MRLASTWLHDCINKHPECGTTFEDIAWLPTRLIYVGSLKQPVARLVASSSLEHRPVYAALSYRWSSTNSHALTLSLQRQYEEESPPTSISETRRDTPHVTRSIGLQYLWVDCLCIIQDESNQTTGAESQ